ncbi:excisionase family DNA-binding protein [Nonomuraea basaltis]|uniref:excisionase family DNA-binding protein n=1 Tax=Nonomuraea basaltis TaxID=2495887 RepID=UPI00110C4CA9|nr:excisionase family DNA-binding protein [Nonomuraea basaltis]TMR91273.1 helix-turn-helix domain-containing protein [Nonomuraea basaltis]
MARAEDSPTYLTVREFAVRYRLSTMTVYRAIANGHLPATRIGRSWRIAQAVADAYDEQAGAVTGSAA